MRAFDIVQTPQTRPWRPSSLDTIPNRENVDTTRKQHVSQPRSEAPPPLAPRPPTRVSREERKKTQPGARFGQHASSLGRESAGYRAHLGTYTAARTRDP